jgi:signal transduction histidine kinase
VHQAALHRALGRIFAVVVAMFVLEFWFSASTLSGQRPASMAANLLLSIILVAQGVRAVRRPPSQRDLTVMALAAAVLLAASWLLAVPRSPFLNQAAYLLVVPVAVAWAALSRRFIVAVPVLLVLLAAGLWRPGASLAIEDSATTLATVAFAAVAARLMRRGAQRADAGALALSRRMAAQEAVLATEEAERRAACAVHDDVLSVLRAIGVAGQALPWRVLVDKAKGALAALCVRAPPGGRPTGELGPAQFGSAQFGPARLGSARLGSALRRRAVECSASLDVRCDIDDDLGVPPYAAEALSAAAGEALRNVIAHAQVGSATVSAHDDGSGGVAVTVADQGIGFETGRVGPASTGLRNGIRARLRDAGGNAEITSAPGRGTQVVLTWRPPSASAAQALDPLAWPRRVAPSPLLIFLGFMLPEQLSSLALLCLRWHDLRWHAAGVAAFAGLFVLTAATARSVSRMRMSRRTAAGLALADAALALLGTLAVAPGTTDGFAYWIGGESSTLIGVIVLLCGPTAGLLALLTDLAALAAGLLAVGNAMPVGGWVGILGSPVLGAGGGLGFFVAFRSLSKNTERQLAEYRDRERRQARAEAMSRVDSTALDHAREVAEPLLSRVASGEPASAALRTEAELAGATLRDELLAPGFFTGDLADRIRAARAAGAQVTVDSARHEHEALLGPARDLLAAALARADAVAEVALHMHPPTSGQPPLAILRLRGRPGAQHAALRQCAHRHDAQLTDLDDTELLVRLRSGGGVSFRPGEQRWSVFPAGRAAVVRPSSQATRHRGLPADPDTARPRRVTWRCHPSFWLSRRQSTATSVSDVTISREPSARTRTGTGTGETTAADGGYTGTGPSATGGGSGGGGPAATGAGSTGGSSGNES